MSSGGSLVWLIWFILCVGTVNLSLCSPGSNNTSCLEVERQALLKFKEGLVYDPRHRLSSWHGEDCCRWEGIGCDNQTAHVRHLDLSFNYFRGAIPQQLGNLSCLQYFSIGENQVNAKSLKWLSGLSSLQHLDLSFLETCQLGSLPSSLGHQNLVSLEVLDLSRNLFDSIPGWFSNLSSLTKLYLSQNNFHGPIPNTVRNLVSLEVLYLGSNELEGNLSDVFEQFKNLTTLDLSNNSFTGCIPASIGRMSFLSFLDLSHNLLNGTIPKNIGQLSELRVLRATDNLLYGKIPAKIGDMNSMLSLDLSRNNLTGPIPSSLSELNFLEDLNLSFNNLSGTGISDVIPDYFWNLPSQFSDLNLSNNQIRGMLPLSFTYTIFQEADLLDLSNNNINGSISPNICKTHLVALDLSNNHLSGELPHCLENLTNFVVVNLANNNLHGEFPSSLKHCKKLNLIDLSQNNFHGNIPSWIWETFPSLKYLQLRSNNFSGIIPQQICDLSSLQVLDLANNHLDGEIPESIVNLVGLQSLNLSGNHLTGQIPTKIGDMESMLSLDLSRNSLSGLIPPSLTELTFMGDLNLSFNNLSGRIPRGSQLQTFTDASYIGNYDLCGPPTSKECPGDDKPRSSTPISQDNEDEDNGEWSEMLWFCMSGFILGCWMVWGILLFKRNWRIIYFLFLDELGDKVYVAYVLFMRRLKATKRN
ncbi:hypothetical protein QJS04_geneDACA021321 [Acorus gramineus]|uniref:Leucine-rich repeat-containing N-terminal plant-type domain-containing protein n=1 Tax=Acorus gramineus TaxID=55184 RepID=A0AAV9AKB3_ACOGR|nr:hypothetical protein QJS04_geneDACA021321 [Acorus gramineus]